jgi:predicted transcriptional regulator
MIASGEKTVEVRKNRPKIKPPFKCYIYCTKHNNEKLSHWSGKVIGEFVCYGIDHFDSAFDEWARSTAPGGSIIDSMGWDKFLEIMEKKARITRAELEKYFPEDVKAYLWHISDLKIYDTPKELGEFTPFCRHIVDDGECDIRIECYYQRIDYNPDGRVNVCRCGKKLSKAPQSWCYIDD